MSEEYLLFQFRLACQDVMLAVNEDRKVKALLEAAGIVNLGCQLYDGFSDKCREVTKGLEHKEQKGEGMDSNGKTEEVRRQMEAFGYDAGPIEITDLDNVRSQVLYKDEVFGIYDFVKHTFID